MIETTFPLVTCPRCLSPFGEELGGISRLDNQTHICTPCEVDESVEDWLGMMKPMTEWPIRKPWSPQE